LKFWPGGERHAFDVGWIFSAPAFITYKGNHRMRQPGAGMSFFHVPAKLENRFLLPVISPFPLFPISRPWIKEPNPRFFRANQTEAAVPPPPPPPRNPKPNRGCLGLPLLLKKGRCWG